MNWLLWFGLIVATWRVTRLLVKDEFPPTFALRTWVIETFWPDRSIAEIMSPPKLTRWQSFWQAVGRSFAYVFTCMWCMSFWVGVGLWWLAVWVGFDVPLPWLMVAAASGFTGAMGALDALAEQLYKLNERKLDQ